MIYFSKGGTDRSLQLKEFEKDLFSIFEKIGKKKRVMAIPPDYTRKHSLAGELAVMAWKYYGDAMTDILPALGTHAPMTETEINNMFGPIPRYLFRNHKWKDDLALLGTVPSNFVKKVSGGAVEYDIPVSVNRLLKEGGHDLILSFGQVVPHEVIGMANYNKNILVGTGGNEIINKSHFLGAAFGMENIMGKADNPVRQVLNYASDNFMKNTPVIYILTVISNDSDGKLQLRGLFIGDDKECFYEACKLSQKINIEYLEKSLDKIVVYLNPSEYKSTWLGNKSIYRTRMAIADKGELLVLAPGIKEFGEDSEIDRLIRKYGYRGTPDTLKAVKNNNDLRKNLCAAAHLIHGSSENRFRITYCPGKLTEKEVKDAGFNYGSIDNMLEIYNPQKLKNGYNLDADGNSFYFINNPSLGLWTHYDKFSI